MPNATPAATSSLSAIGRVPQPIIDAVTFVLSLGSHAAAVVLLVAVQAITLDLDGPGDRMGPDDAPVGNDGGDAGGEQIQVPAHPVQVSVYQPAAPKADTPTPKQTTQKQPTEASKPTDANTTPGNSEGDGDAKKEGVGGKPPRGNKKPCEPVEEITQVSATKWKVERSIVDWYAVHLRELEKQAGVGVHRGEDGKRDGARLYLPRCSILRQAGFRGGDVVHSVNGHKVTNIANGVKTYAKVRNDKKLNVDITRKNGSQVTLTYKLVH